LAGLRQHKTRLATTALAIALGTMFVTATLVFTAGLGAHFDARVMGGSERVDAVAAAEEAGGIPAGALEAVRGLEEVAAADGTPRGSAVLLDSGGRRLGEAPAVVLAAPGRVSRFPVAAGAPPSAADEAALATTTAEAGGFGVGDEVRLVDAGGRTRSFRVSGLVDFGVEAEVLRRGAVVLEAGAAREVSGVRGLDEVAVRGAEGVSQERVAEAVAGVLGGEARVWTGRRFGELQAEEAGVQARSVSAGLGLFAGVALFVSVLVVSNTFAVLAARRVRETALLRCLGAGRGQVFAAAVGEAVLLGAAASVPGAVAGAGAAAGALVVGGGAVAGVSGGVEPVVGAGPVAAGAAAGVVATVGAVLRPAWEATRTAPVEALRSGAAGGSGPVWGRARAVVAAAGFAGAGAAAGAGSVAEPGAGAMCAVAAGGVLCFFGVMAVAPAVVGRVGS
ncbi:ABC transporter permease, partial [Nocardiopsis potens]|uniref:ABC transporter permease n=1 Tax=Nocardiopsis potens TaxID=1246458 RepID=UPI0003708F10